MNKTSYALGMSIAHNMLSSGVTNLELDDFYAGLKATLTGETPAISIEEAGDELERFFNELEKTQADALKKEGAEWLAKNAKKDGVTTTASGLQYKVITKGMGRKPSLTSKVRCHYEGRFLDGRVFDSSYERKEPAVFGVTQVIKGWTEALPMMGEGSKWELYIPYDLAYGEQGAQGAIPPYATLIFTVELLEVL